MTYEGMKYIRNKKKISRKQMSEDLNIPVSLIKSMETEDIEPIEENTINKITKYLGVDDVELVVINVKQKIQSMEIPTNINIDKVKKLFTTVQLKYSPIQNTKQFDTFLAEFKYRLGDLPTKEEENIQQLESDTDIQNIIKGEYSKNKKSSKSKVRPTEDVMSICEDVYAIYSYLKYLDYTIEGEDLYTLIHTVLDMM